MLRKFRFLLIIAVLSLFGCNNKQSMDNNQDPLQTTFGAFYQPNNTLFKVWSPVSEKMILRIYEDGHSNSLIETHDMKVNNGIWSLDLKGDYRGKYYTYQAIIEGATKQEVADPYAKAVGLNGKRAMVVNLPATNPKGWENDQKPAFSHANDAIIYELHIRDFSISEQSGLKNKGKFLAFTESNTSYQSTATGISHLKDLGVTHVHLLPSFDFRSIDESQLEQNQYNWGYDPQNYNTPEGSYSTDPKEGALRIKEFKQMVMALHNHGIRVIMDVVYNHTGATEESNFNQLYPGYYYRQNSDGGFSNASACGNEIASEKPMMRKFIVESVKYWVEEYHIDGFRFDLMGIHDIETMNMIAKEVKAIDPSIILYGEGWTAGASPLDESRRAVKNNVNQMNDFAVFSDEIRDGIKGHWADHEDKGFASGKPGMKESVKFGIVAGTEHPQLDYDKVNYTQSPRSNGPWQSINYVACHDDLTLWDKLDISTDRPKEALTSMHLLANTIVFTSQGIPFLHAGAEFLRTKNGDSNSYKSSDAVNKLDWELKAKNKEIYQYYKQLIKMRKEHPVFRLKTTEEIQQRLTFIDTPDLVIAYQLDGRNLPEETWKTVFIAFNGSDEEQVIPLPAGEWETVLRNQHFSSSAVTDNILINPKTALILKSR